MNSLRIITIFTIFMSIDSNPTAPEDNMKVYIDKIVKELRESIEKINKPPPHHQGHHYNHHRKRHIDNDQLELEDEIEEKDLVVSKLEGVQLCAETSGTSSCVPIKQVTVLKNNTKECKKNYLEVFFDVVRDKTVMKTRGYLSFEKRMYTQDIFQEMQNAEGEMCRIIRR
jgi:hypothetical protein